MKGTTKKISLKRDLFKINNYVISFNHSILHTYRLLVSRTGGAGGLSSSSDIIGSSFASESTKSLILLKNLATDKSVRAT